MVGVARNRLTRRPSLEKDPKLEDGILKLAVSWALDRLTERNTWAAWIGVATVKFGVTLNPNLDTLLVNLALAAVAVVGYALKGQPLFEKVKK